MGAVTAADTIRVDHETVLRRPTLDAPPMALAAVEGVCDGCGETVVVDEPVALVGSQVVQDPDGGRSVDLSGAEWRCQRCTGGVL